MEPHGKAAERVVFERLRAALPSPEYPPLRQRRVARSDARGRAGQRRRGGPRGRPRGDGHPRAGGEVGRPVARRPGTLVDRRSRARTATRSNRRGTASTSSSASSRRCPTGRRGPSHAPATRSPCPTSDLASLPRGHVLLGADAPRELVLDAQASRRPSRSVAGSSAPAPTGSATGREATRSEPSASGSSTRSSPQPGRCTAWSAGGSRTTGPNCWPRAPSRSSSSTAPGGSAGWRSSDPPAAGSRCWPPRRPAGWRARAIGRSSSASTSAWRRA